MRNKAAFLASVIAVALGITMLGAVMPSCYKAPEPFGRICASPIEGGEYCEDSNVGPARAWEKADANGSLPIQMWVERPSKMSFDELVKSRDKLNQWFAVINEVIHYVRDTQGNAESYKASLDGKLGASLRKAKDRQKELLTQTGVDAVGKFKTALTEKANAEKDPLVATIATDKQSMGAVENIFQAAKVDAGPLATKYASLIQEFAAYRATEADETQSYAKLGAEASTATLEDLDAIEQTLVEFSLVASAKPNDLVLNALKLSAEIQQFEIASQQALGPHADFMATHGAAMPDMTSGALRSVNAILGYVDRRIARSDATAKSLLFGMGMRRQALKVLASNPMVKAQVVDAKLQKASAAFSDTAEARLVALAPPPQSSQLSLPFLAVRYDELVALLQLKPLCDPSASWWRETGCEKLRPQFDAAAAYRSTLPTLIAKGLSTLKSTGADPALITAAQAKLDAGDIKGAAVLHDAALRSAEGT